MPLLLLLPAPMPPPLVHEPTTLGQKALEAAVAVAAEAAKKGTWQKHENERTDERTNEQRNGNRAANLGIPIYVPRSRGCDGADTGWSHGAVTEAFLKEASKQIPSSILSLGSSFHFSGKYPSHTCACSTVVTFGGGMREDRT